ncbi:Pre-mRNA-splicing factor SPF27 [Lasiosphaeria ovina]|uniref:Pre-mRNA-splicing factor SPF27 n=1 Tax=Lasiosphaeria ovina TaxID=92902 RepID=A0AAE0KCB1_9PEZI|nr:Pre-mRNA-splicing factor SPF27 [Lasiosphaeria ovina]
MPAITTVHESLPYIDTEPTAAERAAATALIDAERASSGPDDAFHALLPPLPSTSSLTPLLEAELARVQASPSSKLSALDLSRYEAPELPSGLASLPAPGARAALSAALARAYASQGYIAGRRMHLALLDSYGKNAWLVGNWQLEGCVRAVERELASARRAIDVVALQRQRAQDEAGPELKGLDETWRRGVSRVLETEAAAEGLRREILEVRRQRAEGGHAQS